MRSPSSCCCFWMMIVMFSHLLSSLTVDAAFGIPLTVCTTPQGNAAAVASSSHLWATKRKGAMDRQKSSPSSGFGEGKESTKDDNDTSSASAYSSSSSKQGTPTAATAVEVEEGSIYSMPAMYDLAFGYRNFEEEVNFLLKAHEKYSPCGEKPKRVLELAAGPARHSITALSLPDTPVRAVTALDSSPEMVAYAKEVALTELEYSQQKYLEIVSGDMCQSIMEQCSDSLELYDTAWILLGSMAHLTTNADVIACFQSAYDALTPDGTLILEMSHPRETFSMVECTRNGWEVPLEDDDGETFGELQIVWGDQDDHFDPITQIRNFTVSMTPEGVGASIMDNSGGEGTVDSGSDRNDLKNVKQVVPLRLFTAQEIDALATCTGFEVAAMYGALFEEINVSSEDEAFRLVCVLRKKEKQE